MSLQPQHAEHAELFEPLTTKLNQYENHDTLVTLQQDLQDALDRHQRSPQQRNAERVRYFARKVRELRQFMRLADRLAA